MTAAASCCFVAHLLPAMQALHCGQCQAVLVCSDSAQRSDTFGRREVVASRSRRFLDPQPYGMPYEPMLPLSAYALAASRYMHEFGATGRHLAEVAVAARGQLRGDCGQKDGARPGEVDRVMHGARHGCSFPRLLPQ